MYAYHNHGQDYLSTLLLYLGEAVYHLISSKNEPAGSFFNSGPAKQHRAMYNDLNGDNDETVQHAQPHHR